MKKTIFFVKMMRFALICLPFLVFVYLFNDYFAFSGKLSFTYDFGKTPTFASPFYPADRAPEPRLQLQTGTRFQDIIGDPVYMDVNLPRSFDTIDVSIDYINSGQPFLEFGLLTYVEPFGITLLPFESSVLEQATESFSTLAGKDPKTGAPIRLYQREPFVSSVDDFFRAPPLDKRIVMYGVDLPVTYRDADYHAQSDLWTFPFMVRGTHEFLTYVKDEQLSFHAEFVDLNREKGQDVITARVVNEDGEEVYRAVMPDDGNSGTDRTTSAFPKQDIAIDNLPEGVYTVSFFMSHDVVLQSLKTAQRYVVVKNTMQTISTHERDDVAQAEFDDLSATMVTNTPFFRLTSTVATNNASVAVDGNPLSLPDVNQPISWRAPDQTPKTHSILPENDGFHVLTMRDQDVKLETQGFFATSPEHFFDPRRGLRALSDQTTLADADIILAEDFTMPQKRANRTLRTQTVHIDLRQTAIDRKHITFVLSAPGISARNKRMEIRSVHFALRRDPLWKRFFQ